MNKGGKWAGWSVMGERAEKIIAGVVKPRGELDTCKDH